METYPSLFSYEFSSKLSGYVIPNFSLLTLIYCFAILNLKGSVPSKEMPVMHMEIPYMRVDFVSNTAAKEVLIDKI